MIELFSESRMLTELMPATSKQELNLLGFTDDEIFKGISDRLQEIGEYTGESIPVISNKVSNTAIHGVDLWNELRPESEEDLFKFHSLTRRKIYSMTGISDYLAVIREKIIRRILGRGKPASLLDFGGSHGHVSIATTQAGIDVTYADIGLEIRKFVQWKLDKRNLKVAFVPIENNRCVFTNRTYDYIVCLDVASHLPDLPRYLKDFHSCLNDGGELFFGDDLYDFKVPWHLRENAIYKNCSRKWELFEDFWYVEQLWANCTVWRKK